MANHQAAAALLLVVSIFVMVAISRADARPTVGPNKMAALSHDSHGRGFMADVVASRQPKPTCDNSEQPEPEPEPKPEPEPEPKPKPEPEPKPKPEPEPEPKPELTCNKVHGVQAGETCCSVGESAGLTQDQFLDFNPNLCCEKLFVGQWVCLEATSGCHD